MRAFSDLGVSSQGDDHSWQGMQRLLRSRKWLAMIATPLQRYLAADSSQRSCHSMEANIAFSHRRPTSWRWKLGGRGSAAAAHRHAGLAARRRPSTAPDCGFGLRAAPPASQSQPPARVIGPPASRPPSAQKRELGLSSFYRCYMPMPVALNASCQSNWFSALFEKDAGNVLGIDLYPTRAVRRLPAPEVATPRGMEGPTFFQCKK